MHYARSRARVRVVPTVPGKCRYMPVYGPFPAVYGHFPANTDISPFLGQSVPNARKSGLFARVPLSVRFLGAFPGIITLFVSVN